MDWGDGEGGGGSEFLYWIKTDTTEKVDFSILKEPGRLRLYGGPYNLSEPASPTMFLRKQTLSFCTWKTKLSFHPTAEHEEAGVVAWWNYLTYSSIGIRTVNVGPNELAGNRARVIRFKSMDGEIAERRLQRFDSDVVLSIECGDSGYQFGFKEIQGTTSDHERSEAEWLGEVSNEDMTKPPPIGLDFSGMLLGLYAFADFRKCTEPADFHYAEIKLSQKG